MCSIEQGVAASSTVGTGVAFLGERDKDMGLLVRRRGEQRTEERGRVVLGLRQEPGARHGRWQGC
jgi:hypothetical protein